MKFIYFIFKIQAIFDLNLLFHFFDAITHHNNFIIINIFLLVNYLFHSLYLRSII